MEKSDDKNGLVAAEVIDAEAIKVIERNVFTRNRSKVIAGILGATIFIGGGIAIAYNKPFARNQAAVSGTQIVEAPVTNGKLSLPEGEYEGEIVGGKANGTGKITFIYDGKSAFRTGDYWVGGFTDNKWHGMGTITYYREGRPPNIKEFDVDEMREWVDPRKADGVIPEPAKTAPKTVATTTTTPTPTTPKATPAVVTPAKTTPTPAPAKTTVTKGKLVIYPYGESMPPADYEGDIVNGKAEGQGAFYMHKPAWKGEGAWKGEIHNNRPGGHGVFIDENGKETDGGYLGV